MRNDQIAIHYDRAINFLDRLSKDEVLIDTMPLKAVYRHSTDPVPFDRRLDGEYKEIQKGEVWGREWDSAWFHITGDIPENWQKKKLAARIDFNGEACIFDSDGCPVQGLTNGSVFAVETGRDLYHLPPSVCESGTVDLWVEAAANALFGVNKDNDPPRNCPKRHGTYEGKVVSLDLAVFDAELWHFILDFEALFGTLQANYVDRRPSGKESPWGTEKELPQLAPRVRRLLYVLNQAIDVYGDDRSNAADAREVLKELFAPPAGGSALTAVSVGHAHIDTGWLWPVRETMRKCARTFASQVALIEKYPEYVFGASQPQHYLFIKQHYPLLYKKIKKYVQTGNWELQGAMWVEADCNITSGESLVRQFLHGKNFFMDEFGVNVRNLWIPDVFGYSAAIPQIMKKAGVEYFLTQKISWSQFNEFPHNTFRWRGIDGSEVVVHFPPEDNYNSQMLPESQIKAQNAFNEGHMLDEYMCLFGVGDGGGGPKENHIERANRLRDMEGSPKVRMGTAEGFFNRLGEHKDQLEVWDGELYLELHRATLTTQAKTKKGNRTLEKKLRDVEFTYSSLPLSYYPVDKLDSMWKTLLLNQFHDILPGSSIKKVYEVTEKEYGECIRTCDNLVEKAVENNPDVVQKGKSLTLVNTLATSYDGLVKLPNSWHLAEVENAGGCKMPVHHDGGFTMLKVEMPALSSLEIHKTGDGTAVHGETPEWNILENDLIRYELNECGEVLSVYDKGLQREMLEAGTVGNKISLYVDRPANWDAWDIDVYYEKEFLESPSCERVEPLGKSDIMQGVKFKLAIGNSKIEQNIILRSGSKRLDFETVVDWDERHKMLRTSFPTAVHVREANCDVQFGYTARPTHRNTSWDMAKFEVAAHKYADLSNNDYGVALLNDCKYGYKVLKNVLDLNLLRSPVHPDPDADIGTHSFTYALLPHTGTLIESDVIEEAQRLNFPPIVAPGLINMCIPVEIDGDGITLAALKRAEKEPNTLVIRLVENRGRFAKCKLTLHAGDALVPCDLMEWQDGDPLSGKSHELEFTPFEIKTFKIKLV